MTYFILMGNWWFEWLRFSSPRANHLFMAAVLLLPVILFIMVHRLPSLKIRTIGIVLMFPILLVSILLLTGWAFMMTMWVPGVWQKDVDYSFEKIRQEVISGNNYSIFRTNWGATSSFGIVVRREVKVLPGLLRVKRVCECYPANEVQLLKNEKGSFECLFPPYGTKRPDAIKVMVNT